MALPSPLGRVPLALKHDGDLPLGKPLGAEVVDPVHGVELVGVEVDNAVPMLVDVAAALPLEPRPAELRDPFGLCVAIVETGHPLPSAAARTMTAPI